ncbi:ABC transporter substrate-binding protein [Arthrobacter sp. Sa2CUA1]|uniref:ABC transporter substrate-binding protein n=1 Tax=Arthrobacter gallicola TaxID=2762225 RepID=A0ABR8UWI3_9MICC|nr:ABC transporter substrate-binding protein [Arthrobacter gallicola]MBD7996883.1 ABC transporter substrate-binding protein [Arthrobacter gallicola]
MTQSATRRSVIKAGAIAAALALAGCTAARPDEDTTSGSPSPSQSAEPTASFIFATAARPAGLDPFLAVDTESHRITRQIMETLVGVDPVTSAPVPLLAETWSESEDGRTYDFTLRRGVTFHDGEPLNAAAVCANFERWYKLPEAARGSEVLTFRSVFKGFADTPELSAYRSCTAVDEYTVRLELATRLTGLIPALASPEFAISSPRALADGRADTLSEERNGTRVSGYAQHPVGTGPFAFTSWTEDEVLLTSNPQYWGDRGEIHDLVFRTITSPESRLRALKNGEVDGYDLVTVSDVGELARAGMQILQRDPYSVLYLGINQNFPGLDEPKMRQAIAHAVDKPALLEDLFLNGTKSANQFLPEKLGLRSDNVTNYGHNTERAKELLEEAGYAGEELPFYYPRRVTRAYLPNPEKVYAELSRQLTAAGLNIRPVPVEWSDGYLEQIARKGDRALHLSGLSGSYMDADNFVGTLFGGYSDEFGYDDPQLFTKIDRARTLPAGEDRSEAYRSISDRISTRVPAVPLAYPISTLTVSPRVAQYPTSPVLNEVFNKVRLTS